MKEIIDFLKAKWSVPAHAVHGGEETGFRFQCTFADGLEKMPDDYPYKVPDDVIDFWSTARSAQLFKDVDSSQWGLEILSPEESLSETEKANSWRPDTFKAGDLVIGKFLGDSDLLVVSCDDDEEYGYIRVALPIDPYEDWYIAANNFRQFMEKYVEAQGDKYWE